jgi:transcription elongation factor Elf1
MNKDRQLLRCPFCNGEASLFKRSMADYVECLECGASTDERFGFREAMELWNTRF